MSLDMEEEEMCPRCGFPIQFCICEQEWEELFDDD